MPNLDGTGPRGNGAKTGRGAGKCTPQQNKEENDFCPKGRGRRVGKASGTRRTIRKGKEGA